MICYVIFCVEFINYSHYKSHLLFLTSPFNYVSSMFPAVCFPEHSSLRSQIRCFVCYSLFFSVCSSVCCSVYSFHLQPPSYPPPSSLFAHPSPPISYPDNSPSFSPGTAALILLAFAAEASVAVLIESVSMQAAA
jgi:hypothetical protein